jgi:hypothetical protein
VGKAKAAGGIVVVGSPGIVDNRYYVRGDANLAAIFQR